MSTRITNTGNNTPNSVYTLGPSSPLAIEMLAQTGQMSHPAIVEMNSTLQKLSAIIEATNKNTRLLEREVTYLHTKMKKSEQRHLKEMKKKTDKITELSKSVHKLTEELNMINYAQRQQAQKTQALTEQLNAHIHSSTTSYQTEHK